MADYDSLSSSIIFGSSVLLKRDSSLSVRRPLLLSILLYSSLLIFADSRFSADLLMLCLSVSSSMVYSSIDEVKMVTWWSATISADERVEIATLWSCSTSMPYFLNR